MRRCISVEKYSYQRGEGSFMLCTLWYLSTTFAHSARTFVHKSRNSVPITNDKAFDILGKIHKPP